MEIPIYTVDAFTNLPFKGNPAAVCPLLHELQDELYQKIAAEMNLSETAFITLLNPTDDFSTGARFRLRWFSPTHEVPLCGHATLASAATLFHHRENRNSTLVFETLSGDLSVRQRGDTIVMDFPLNKPVPQEANDFKEIIKAGVGDHPVQDVCLCPTTKKLLVRISDTCNRSVLTSLEPDPQALLASERSGRVKGLVVTMLGAPQDQVVTMLGAPQDQVVTMLGAPQDQPGYDFYSRNFSPWYGIPEDPVTGSSHTVLASYWSEKLGKKKLLAYQCSSRGGELQLEVRDDGRVDIAGQAVTVLQGTLTL